MNRREQVEAATRWARAVLDPAAKGAADDTGGERAQAAWAALELPPAPGAPATFARQVARAWEAERAGAAAPLLAVGWMRAAAVGALLAGIALGSTLSYAGGNAALETTAALDTSSDDDDSWLSTSLSEEYLSALSSPEAILERATDGDAAADGAPEGSQASEP